MSKSDDYSFWVKKFADNIRDVEVPTAREAEEASIVVCRLVTEPLLYRDNVVAPCSKCFRMLQFRPHAPKKPPKMCDGCARKEIDTATDDVSFMATQNTIDDVVAFVARKKMN